MANSAKELRTEHVGSMQRPAALLDVRQQSLAGKATPEELRAAEDKAIRAALELQEAAGVSVVTDGEFRRFHYGSHINDAIDGFRPFTFGDIERKLSKKRRFIPTADVEFMVENAKGQWKMTLPTPARVRPEMLLKLNPAAIIQESPPPPYADFHEVQSDMVDFYIDEVEGLAADGCTYVQFDKVITPFVNDEYRQGIVDQGGDPDEELAAEIAWENKAYDAARDAGLITSMHFCRGNRGTTEADYSEGGYDAAAEQLFNDLNVDRLLLEYDTERAGGFEPLRFVPKGRVVVLGLLSTKTTKIEDKDTLLRRIDEASQHIDPSQLAIGPQCGFSSGAVAEDPERMTIEAEKKKLALMTEVAAEAWGSYATASAS
jgi:5-methyltetrahydropteroyltriglutamate--homocysteine methyltransferase